MLSNYLLKAAIVTVACFVFVLGAEEVHVGFYSDFEPISYAVSRDVDDPEFHSPKGYEVDLLKAIERIPGSEITFIFHGIKEWDRIWLRPYHDAKIDLVLGGITYETRRLLNEDGEPVVEASHPTVNFKQSLLVRAEIASLIQSHDDLTAEHVVGVVKGTTGEYRFLAQADIIKGIDSGQLNPGFQVVLEDGQILVSDGTLSIYDKAIEQRTKILPPNDASPVTLYFTAEDSMIPALQQGEIDAIARGYIGNQLVSDRSSGQLVVKAIYSLECPKQQSIYCEKKEESVFFVKKGNSELLNKLNHYIDFLTDQGNIDYDAWKENPDIFFDRANGYTP